MPSWGEILKELGELQASPPDNLPQGVSIYDYVRRKYLSELHALTGRNTVLYASDWLSPSGPNKPVADVGISLRDMQGLMEVFRGLSGEDLDLILHSPGGSVEAVDRLVRYMRSKFKDVRVFVPLAAMSAGTMWSLAADRIVMGKHSQLGPTDPQVFLPSGLKPAGGLRQEFNKVVEECRNDPARLSAWLPILQQYSPGLLQLCEDAEELGQELVEEWLRTYMFADLADGEAKAKEAAAFFADQKLHKAHGRGVDREQARRLGIAIENLEDDQDLQDAVLSVHHAAMHTFGSTAATKLVENHLGRAWIEQSKVVMVQMPQQVNPAGATPIPGS
ncbi:serine protease [Planomonospora venezuelensis]|nr:serine protease [Planomonospora venezuelensis]